MCAYEELYYKESYCINNMNYMMNSFLTEFIKLDNSEILIEDENTEILFGNFIVLYIYDVEILFKIILIKKQ